MLSDMFPILEFGYVFEVFRWCHYETLSTTGPFFLFYFEYSHLVSFCQFT